MKESERVEEKPKIKGKWAMRQREGKRTERRKGIKDRRKENFLQASLEIQLHF